MREIHESIFFSSLRSLFKGFFSVLGIAIALAAIALAYYGIFKTVDEESFPSKVKILTDAEGHRKKLGSSTPIILQIKMEGAIGADKLTGKGIEDILLDSRDDAFKNDRVKAVLLVINSPGGGVNDSDSIYRHIKHYKEQYKVPVYAYVDGLCASGGYYIACAADKIFASDVSLVGSIGVLSWPPFMNVVDTLQKIGVQALTITAGKDKDQMNPFRPWQPDEQEHYQSLIDFYYGKFVGIVTEDRNIEREKIVQELGAKILPAPEALAFGLIDQSGYSRAQVIADLAKAAKIEGKYQVVGFEATSWWKKLFKEDTASPLITGKIKHELKLPKFDGNPFCFS